MAGMTMFHLPAGSKQINFFKITIFFFILLNLIFRFETFFYYNRATSYIFVIAAPVCFFSILYDKCLTWLLFIFGASLCLYGFHSNSIYNLTFEYLLCLITMTVFIVNTIAGETRTNYKSPITAILILYSVLALFSLFSVPLSNLGNQFFLNGPLALGSKILLSHPSNYFYSIAGVNRLILFFIFIQQLSCHHNSKSLYKILFTGILAGTICAIILGLCDYYSLMSLAGFRNLDPIVNPGQIQYRLQSTFGHPGWFAEFITITIPIILVFFFKKNRAKITTVFLFSALLLCEIVLILAKARAGWISYPLTLFFCWLFFYSSKDDTPFSWHKKKSILLKVCISIPITIIVSFLIISQFMGESSSQIPNLKHERKLSENEVYRVKYNSLKSRMASLFKIEDRLYLWEDGVKVGQESPIWGMGYESFNWQAHNLANIPKSHFSETRRLRKIFDTPHNLYVQLFISNGLTGLLIWCLLIGTMLYLLIKDFITSRDHFHLIVILSTISFHIYGIFQSLQYIPCIWFLIFLNLGYTIAVQKSVVSAKRIDKTDWIVKFVYITIACAGIIFYVSNAGSEKIHQKYNSNFISTQNSYIGFYAPENWSGKTFRWTAGNAIITIPKTGKFRVTLLCSHPDIKQHPVTVILKTSTRELDRIIFTEEIFVTKEYELSSDDQSKIFIKVSRTWTPEKAGINADNRILGVAVSELEYLDE